MFKPNASFLVLYTTNVSQTHDFYQKLGCEIKEVADDKVVVKCGDFDLHFILDSTEPQDSYRYIAKPGNYGQGVIFYLETENISVTQQQITDAGGTVKAPVFDNHWGCKELLFEDPNGYKFAVYQ